MPGKTLALRLKWALCPWWLIPFCVFCLFGHFAHAGLTLASALAGYVNCGLLLFLLVKRGVFKPSPGWLKYCLQLLLRMWRLRFIWS